MAYIYKENVDFKKQQKDLTKLTINELTIQFKNFIDEIKKIDSRLYEIKTILDDIHEQFDYGRVTISFGKRSPKFLIYHKPIKYKDLNGNILTLINGKPKLMWAKSYCDSYIKSRLKNKFKYIEKHDVLDPIITEADLLIKQRKNIQNLFYKKV